MPFQLIGRLAQSAALRPTVMSAAGEELQVSGRKMAFVGGHAQR